LICHSKRRILKAFENGAVENVWTEQEEETGD
jgi:hypothetical protein